MVAGMRYSDVGVEKLCIGAIALALSWVAADAAPLTKDQAIAAAKKLCASRLPENEHPRWIAYSARGGWFIEGAVLQPKPKGAKVIVPASGVLPKKCEQLAVTVTN
jgi:hypothetical protein